MDEAWEYLADGGPELADRLSARAVKQGPMNPRLWLDRGRILIELSRVDLARQALDNALELAPGYVEARAVLDRLSPPPVAVAVAADESPRRWRSAPPSSPRTDRYDWDAIGDALLFDGAARLPGLLDAAECGALIEAFADEQRFEHAVRIDDERKGQLEYRFPRAPIPLIESLRLEVHTRLAAVADRRSTLLGDATRYPPHLEDQLDLCRRAGQRKRSPILLRYPPGGFNALHRDLAGEVWFPFQLAVTLGPASSASGDGGALALSDEGPGRRKRRHVVDTAVGDGVVFATRDRLVRVGGVVGLQPVRHGVTRLARERYALGVPFHDYR